MSAIPDKSLDDFCCLGFDFGPHEGVPCHMSHRVGGSPCLGDP